MADTYIQLPATGQSPYWGNAVATFAALGTGQVDGEVALTLDTRQLYSWNQGTVSWSLLASGDVVGGGSSTDNALARYDGTSGKLLQNSVAILTDAGDLSGIGALSVASATIGSLSGPLRGAAGAVGTGSTSLTSEVSGVLPVANGGTNSSTALSNNRILTSQAGAIKEAAAITALRVLVSNASGIPTSSSVTSTTLSFLDATSSVQTQLDSKQAAGSYITDLTGDITASGPGSAAATVTHVGASLASTVSNATIAVGNATAANTSSTLILRDSLGSFAAGSVTAETSALVGATGSPATSAALEVKSTTKAFLLCRMTTTQRDAISTPVNGMMVYNTTTDRFQGYTAGAWADLQGWGS